SAMQGRVTTRGRSPEESGTGGIAVSEVSEPAADSAEGSGVAGPSSDAGATLMSTGASAAAESPERHGTGPEDSSDGHGTKLRVSGCEVGAASVLTAVASSNPVSSRPVLSRSDSGLEPVKGSTLSGRYRLEGILGRGGMGVVYRAADLQMPGVEVAIKLLLPEFRAQPELLN